MEVLRSNHPSTRPPMAGSFEAYRGKHLAFVPVNITDKTVASVARRLSGSAGTGGTDSSRLQHWLLWFGVAIVGLQKIVREFGDCMPNGHPPWAAYMELMSGRLVGLNKFPGVRPVGVGETWIRMLAKCVLAMTEA